MRLQEADHENVARSVVSAVAMLMGESDIFTPPGERASFVCRIKPPSPLRSPDELDRLYRSTRRTSPLRLDDLTAFRRRVAPRIRMSVARRISYLAEVLINFVDRVIRRAISNAPRRN